MLTRLSGIWYRPDHVVDVFIDAEFVDAGTNNLHPISIGCVIATSKQAHTFYGINEPFFNSQAFYESADPGSKNGAWMLDNIFKHFHGSIIDDNGKRVYGTVSELARDHGAFDKHSRFFLNHNDKMHTLPDGDEFDTFVSGDWIKHVGPAFTRVLDDMYGDVPAEERVTRLWTYYGAYDQVVFTNMYGAMVELPDHFRYFNYDIRLMTEVYGYDHDDLNPCTPHHALADALAQYKTTQKLRSMLHADFGDTMIPDFNRFW